MIEKSEWYWCGYPGHFIAASMCRYSLHTRVGNFRISTVGDYHVSENEPMETIGSGEDSFFETYIFNVVDDPTRPEGQVLDYGEIDGERYADSEDAERGHYRYCEKYANHADEIQEALERS